MVNKRPWSGPVGSRRELLRLEWPPPSQSEITANRRQQRAEMLRQLNEGGRKLNVNIKRLHPDAVVPKYETQLAAGFDLVAVEDVIIAPGETAKIPLGLAFEIPPGYVMYVMMRSGIALKTKLRQSNGIGVIDADYRGEVAMMFDNTSEKELFICRNAERGWSELVASNGVSYDISGNKTDIDGYLGGTYIIRKGDRICQAVIQRYDPVTFTVVDELGATERGSGGFGHTGVN